MAKTATRLEKILTRLEKLYRKQKPVGPTDAYEMVLYRNAGYPQSDERCTKGFEALKKGIGLRPEEILAVPHKKLAEVVRAGGDDAGVACDAAEGNCADREQGFQRRFERRLETAATGGEEGAEEVSDHFRCGRGENSAVHQDGSGGGPAFKLPPRSTAAGIWDRAEKLGGKLSRGPGGGPHRIAGRLRCLFTCISAAEAPWGRAVQGHAATMRGVSCL